MAYLDNIRTFVRVYELGSMSAAGRDLRVSAAVASARIGQLETHLGVRLFQRMRFSAQFMSPDGTTRKFEAKGPPDFIHWSECWRVFRTAATLLGSLSFAVLERYHDHIERAHTKYGASAWPLIYQADVRARKERLRRIGQSLVGPNKWTQAYTLLLADAAWFIELPVQMCKLLSNLLAPKPTRGPLH